MYFFNSPEYAYLEETEPISTLKNLSCRKYSFQKLTQFSLGNNVLDAPASNTISFLLRETDVSSTQLNSLFGAKCACLHLENSDVGKYSCQQLTIHSQGINVL
jgi:hypothetical protein